MMKFLAISTVRQLKDQLWDHILHNTWPGLFKNLEVQHDRERLRNLLGERKMEQ